MAYYAYSGTPGSKPRVGSMPKFGHPMRPDYAYLINEGTGARLWDTVTRRATGPRAGSAGGPSWVPFGMSFNAASTQYISNDSVIVARGTTAPFFMAVLFTNVDTGAGNRCLYSEARDDDTDTIAQLDINNTLGVLRFVMRDTGAGSVTVLSASGPYNDGKPHIALATSNGTRAFLYVDGKFITSGALPTGSVICNTATIGASNRAATINFPYNGNIGFVILGRRFLSAQQAITLTTTPYCWVARGALYTLESIPPVSSGTNDVIYPGRNARCGRSIISHW